MKIAELENQIELGLAKLRGPEFVPLQANLEPLIPKGLRPRVSLRGEQRKKKSTASAESWSPQSGDTILIRFEPDIKDQEAQKDIEPGTRRPAARIDPTPATTHATSTSTLISDLVRALDRAESRPGWEFVALKWFRDTALVEEGFLWAQSETTRRDILREAIEGRLVLTSKIQNLRSPQFPVTTLKLNRLLPEVQTILRGSGQGGEDFEPVSIRGEALSATVRRDRR